MVVLEMVGRKDATSDTCKYPQKQTKMCTLIEKKSQNPLESPVQIGLLNSVDVVSESLLKMTATTPTTTATTMLFIMKTQTAAITTTLLVVLIITNTIINH